jgi:hypothetical protein
MSSEAGKKRPRWDISVSGAQAIKGGILGDDRRQANTSDQTKAWKAIQAQVQMLAKKAQQARDEKATKSN